jgi:hypothetical protein
LILHSATATNTTAPVRVRCLAVSRVAVMGMLSAFDRVFHGVHLIQTD